MRRRYRYDEDLDCLVEIGNNANYFEEPKESGPAVISDDVGAGVNGLRHMPSGKHYDSKSKHRVENKARGLEEVGNQADFATPRKPDPTKLYEQTVHEAKQQIEHNHNGTADWLRWRERQ